MNQSLDSTEETFIDKLTAVQMDFWRRSARKSRLKKFRNSEIRIMEVEESTVNLMEI